MVIMINFREERFAKGIIAEFIFATYDSIHKNLFLKNKANATSYKKLEKNDFPKKHTKTGLNLQKFVLQNTAFLGYRIAKISSAKQQNAITYTVSPISHWTFWLKNVVFPDLDLQHIVSLLTGEIYCKSR